MSRKAFLRHIPLALLLLFAAQRASADTVTYTFQGYATGSVGATSFTNSAFTITLTADSGNISEFAMSCSPSNCTVFDVQAATAALTVDGMTTAITSPIGVFDNQTVDVLGLSRITGPGPGGIGMDLLDLTDPAFATYNLATPLAPVGPFNLGGLGEFSCASGCVLTSVGNVSMSSASGVTFTDPISTPEPASLLLLGTGALAVLALRRSVRARTRS